MVQRTVGKRSFATDKPGAKPAGKPGAAPASAPAGPPVDPDMDFPPPPSPEPKRPMAPHDPKNPLHSQFPGWPTTPPGEVPSHVKNIAEAIGRLNMVEAMQLNLILQSHLGITEENVKSWFGSMSGVVYAAPPGGAAAAGAAGGAAGAAAAPKEEKKEKTTWNLKLVKVEEASKIKILKEIRLLRPGINLQEVLYYYLHHYYYADHYDLFI